MATERRRLTGSVLLGIFIATNAGYFYLDPESSRFAPWLALYSLQFGLLAAILHFGSPALSHVIAAGIVSRVILWFTIPVLESRRQSFIAHPYITYDLDAAGNLLPPAIPTEGGVATELLEKLIATKTASDALPFRILPSFFRSDHGTTYVPLLIELDGSTLASSDGRVDVSFFGALENAKGEVVQRFEERAELEAGDHVRYEIPLQAPPGEYRALIGVLDEESGTHGSRVSMFEVPGFDRDDVLLSSVVLYDAAIPTSPPIPTSPFAF